MTPLTKQSVKFGPTKLAMEVISDLLTLVDGIIDKLISSLPNNELGYGSEFRPTEIMESLPNWKKIKKFLDCGFSVNFKLLDDTQRLKNNIKALRKGNHK